MLVLIIELSQTHITRDDIIGLVAFLSGIGFVVAFLKMKD